MHIDIPDHAVVIAIGGRHAPIAELLDRVPAAAVPWDVDRPEPSADALRAEMKASGRARVAIARAHAKAVQDAAAIGRKAGAVSIVLRLPGAPDVDKGLAKVDRVIDLADADVGFGVVPMPVDLRHMDGPFDIVGDVHGVIDELRELLGGLGHLDADGNPRVHPQGRTLVFLGDYTDRGPANKAVLETVRAFTALGALAIAGNHDDKLLRWLMGKNVRVAAGLAGTIAELERETPEWRADMAAWLGSLQTHLVLAGGRLVVAHAGLDEALHGRMVPAARAMALYGKPLDGGTVLDDDGYPQAEDWAQSYSGAATVVHGHVVQWDGPREVNGVHGIDGGAVFGGELVALRWPEMTYERVRARRAYFEAHRRPA